MFLNDKTVGEKLTGRGQEFKAVFDVPYAPGILKAVGVNGDRVVAESVLATADPPEWIGLSADRMIVQVDGQDLSS